MFPSVVLSTVLISAISHIRHSAIFLALPRLKKFLENRTEAWTLKSSFDSPISEVLELYDVVERDCDVDFMRYFHQLYLLLINNRRNLLQKVVINLKVIVKLIKSDISSKSFFFVRPG